MPRLTPFWRATVGAAVLGAALLCAAVAALSIRTGDSPSLIASDGKAYYVWARSVLIDGDVDFANDYRLLYPPDPLPPESARFTPSGLTLSKTPIGLAVLEAPGVLLGTASAKLLGFPADGVSLPYQLAVCGTLVAFFIAAWFLLFRALLRWGVAPPVAFLLWIGMLAATNLIHYIAKEPAMAHAPGVAGMALIVFLVAGWPAGAARPPRARALAVGALFALLLLIRNAHVVMLPFVVALLAARRAATLRTLAWAGLAAALVLSLQVAATVALWGRFGFNLYPGESFVRDPTGIWLALFSSRHGLFTHHPWYALLLILNVAALFGSPKTRWISAGALAGWIFLALGNGLWWCWWFGDSFGHRAFIEALVPLTFGAAVGCGEALAAGRRRLPTLAAILVLCALANAYLWAGYLLQRYPHDGSAPLPQVYAWPLE